MNHILSHKMQFRMKASLFIVLQVQVYRFDFLWKGVESQRPKNPGSRVALLPGKFLRIRIFCTYDRNNHSRSPIFPVSLSRLPQHCLDGAKSVRTELEVSGLIKKGSEQFQVSRRV